MPRTYTVSGLTLPGNGEESGVWGTLTNTNMQILDRLISQAGTISLSGTAHTLTVSDGILSDGQYGVLVFGGAPTGTNTVTISPNDAKRTYIVKNTSGETVTLTQGSGGNVSVPDGRTAIVYCDGAGSTAAVVNVSDTLVDSTITAIGALTPTDGVFVVGDGTTWVTESGDTALASLGLTATAAELNILDGVTATTAELNILDGVTATTAEINVLDGVTATTAELNVLDGVTATTAELNYVDGVTSNIQTQLDGKAANTTQATATWEAGTGTTESLVSPAKVKAAIDALAPDWSFATEVTTSGGETAIDFTGIPANVNSLWIWLESLDAGSDRVLIQFGTTGGFVTSNYITGSGWYFGNATSGTGTTTRSGFLLENTYSGQPILSYTIWRRHDQSNNKWSGGGAFSATNGLGDVVGSIELTDLLTQVRITRSGSSSFVAGGKIAIGWSY